MTRRPSRPGRPMPSAAPCSEESGSTRTRSQTGSTFYTSGSRSGTSSGRLGAWSLSAILRRALQNLHRPRLQR
eukprot:2554868-Alexandrium_andersonii.AAC.1